MNNYFNIGAWVVKPNENLLVLNGDTYSVEPLAMDVLLYLYKNAGSVISRDELVDNVWQGRIVGDHAVYRIINQLRKTLREDQGTDYIKTIRKKGYQLKSAFVVNTADTVFEENSHSKVTDDALISSIQSRKISWTPYLFIIPLLITAIFLYVLFKKTYQVEAIKYKALKPFSVLTGEEKDPAFSFDGKRVAYSHRSNSSDNYKIFIQSIGGGATQLTKGKGDDISPSWSPKGDALIFLRLLENTCQIIKVTIDAKESPLTTVLDCGAPDIENQVVWGLNDYLYYTNSESAVEPYKIYRYSVRTGKKEQLTNPSVGHSKGDINFALSNSNQFIAYKRDLDWGNTRIELLNLNTKEVMPLFTLSGWKRDLSWSKDDNFLFYTDIQNKVYRYEIATREHQLITTSQVPIHGLASAPNSDDLLVVIGETGSDIAISALSHPSFEKFISSSEVDVYPEFANNSMRVAFLSSRSGDVQVWLKSEIGEEKQLTNFTDKRPIKGIRWSPDDKYLVSYYYNKLYIIDAFTGLEEIIWEYPESVRVESPSWSKDGEHIYFSSNQDGDWQTYKLSFLDKKPPIKLTDTGSYGAVEVNENLVYFKYHHDGLWLKDISTGEEKKLLDNTSVFAYDSLYPFNNGFYYISVNSSESNWLKYFDLSNFRDEDVMPIDNLLIDVSISHDKTWILIPQLSRDETAIKLLERSD